MRLTLHEYVIDVYDKADTTLESCATALDYINDFAKLTNREPRLGDFVPCDENGNVLEKPDIHSLDHSIASALNYEYKAAQDRVIFAGDWEVIQVEEGHCITIQGERFEIGFYAKGAVMLENDFQEPSTYRPINRIEDLPREIEFKPNVI